MMPWRTVPSLAYACMKTQSTQSTRGEEEKGAVVKLKLTIHDNGLDRRSHGAARNTNAVTIRSTN
jgi:hypothetical protein